MKATTKPSPRNFVDYGAVDPKVCSQAVEAFLLDNVTAPYAPNVTAAHRGAGRACKLRLGLFDPTSRCNEINVRTWSTRDRAWEIRNALSTEKGSSGAFLKPEGFIPALELALDAYSVVRRVATTVRADGDPVRQPGVDSPGEALALPDEAALTQTAPTFKQTVWILKTFFSQIPVSAEWWEDTPDPAIAIALLSGESLAVRQNRWYTTSNGGLIANAVARASAGSAVMSDDLENLMGDVTADAIENGQFMLSPTAFTALRKLKDGSGARLLRDGKIVDFPYCINKDLDAAGAGVNSVPALFGDFRKGFKIVDHSVVNFQPHTETLAHLDQTLWIGRQRSDGAMMNRGGRPYISKLVMSA